MTNWSITADQLQLQRRRGGDLFLLRHHTGRSDSLKVKDRNVRLMAACVFPLYQPRIATR